MSITNAVSQEPSEVTLPLVFFPYLNTCPLPLKPVTYQVLWTFACSDQQREALNQHELQAQRYQSELSEAVLKAKTDRTPMPNAPCSPGTMREVYGALVVVPDELTNPRLYAWMQNPPMPQLYLKDESEEVAGRRNPSGVWSGLPYFLKLRSDAWFAVESYNAVQSYEKTLATLAETHGFTGDYDAPFLWMLMSGKATPELFGMGPNTREHVAAVAPIWLTHHLLSCDYAGIMQAALQTVRGMKYITTKERNGKADV